MRKNLPSRTKSNDRSRRNMLLLLILLVAMLLIASWLRTHPDPVMANAPLQAWQDAPTERTPSPAPTSTGATHATSPVIGILVLLAPLVFLAWKSRGAKEPKITASCCVPVIDENQRPFQIPDEPEGSRSSANPSDS